VFLYQVSRHLTHAHPKFALCSPTFGGWLANWAMLAVELELNYLYFWSVVCTCVCFIMKICLCEISLIYMQISKKCILPHVCHRVVVRVTAAQRHFAVLSAFYQCYCCKLQVDSLSDWLSNLGVMQKSIIVLLQFLPKFVPRGGHLYRCTQQLCHSL